MSLVQASRETRVEEDALNFLESNPEAVEAFRRELVRRVSDRDYDLLAQARLAQKLEVRRKVTWLVVGQLAIVAGLTVLLLQGLLRIEGAFTNSAQVSRYLIGVLLIATNGIVLRDIYKLIKFKRSEFS